MHKLDTHTFSGTTFLINFFVINTNLYEYTTSKFEQLSSKILVFHPNQ